MATRTAAIPSADEDESHAPTVPVATVARSSAGTGLALLLLLLGVVTGISVVEPGDGVITVLVAGAVRLWVGVLAPLVPALLVLSGGWLLLRSVFGRPKLPVWRIAGLGILALCSLPILTLLGSNQNTAILRARVGMDGGMAGFWLSALLVEWLGAYLTATVLLVLLVVGALLVADRSFMDVLWASRQLGHWAAPRGRSAVRWMQDLAVGHPRRAGARLRQLPTRPVVWTLPHRPAAPVPRVAPPPVASPPPPVAQPPVTSPPPPSAAASVPVVSSEEPPPDPLAETAPLPPALVATVPIEQDVAPPLQVETWLLPSREILPAKAERPPLPTDSESRARLIEETLAGFNVQARVIETRQGPTVTQFGIEPADGVAVSRILARQADLALRLGAVSLRVEAPVPGRHVVGLEVPNEVVAPVTLEDVIDAPEWEAAKGPLRLALGRDVAAQATVGDLGRMPHLLIAGATGSGKSVCLNTIIASLLYQLTPDELQMVMIDPKKVEMSGFVGVPHLRLPVITEMEHAVGALKWVVQEMDRRYRLFAERGSRNLESFNKTGRLLRGLETEALPYLVVIIDELADLMMTTADEVEKALCRLAQLARATGIHLVVATQRPSVDVLTGLIKANFPTRLAFAVSSQTDSRVILDTGGAEKLLGRGDALYLPTDAMKPVRLQGAFVSDEDLQALVAHWTAQGGPRFTADEMEEIASLGKKEDEDDDLYDRATELAETVGRISASLLQRKLGIGFMRAQRIRDRLIADGLGNE